MPAQTLKPCFSVWDYTPICILGDNLCLTANNNFTKIVSGRNNNLKNTEYIRTDLAAEAVAAENRVSVKEYTENGFSVHEVNADGHDTGLPKGRYITLTVGPLWFYGKDTLEKATDTLASFISQLTLPFNEHSSPSILAVCLGNRRITSDAVGPLCAEKLIVTRHLKSERDDLFFSLGGRELSVITPGVTGETGIETFDIIRSAVNTVKPSLVICIDALAARSVDRLATTVQLSDAGVSPGSGVGNHRKEISHSTLGVPVFSIGVPTVVQSSTLVYDALEKAGINDVSDSLRDVLENEKSFFVTPKNADVAVAAQATLISKAINKSIFGFEEL